MTNEVKKRGLFAEQRVVNLAREQGLDARMASATEDHGKKTDVVIEDLPFQVSLSNKSKKQRANLARRGITPIEAGSQVTDDSIVSRIWQALSGKNSDKHGFIDNDY